MISSEWHRVINIFSRKFCFVSMSRVFLIIFFDVILYVIWIFFCSITLIAIFNFFLEESVDIFFVSMSNLIITISHHAIVAQVLFFLSYVFFFFTIFFNRVVIFFNFLIVFVDLNIDGTFFVRMTRDVLIN